LENDNRNVVQPTVRPTGTSSVMRVKRSYLFAGGIGAVVVAYFAVSAVTGRGKHAEAAPKPKKDDLQLVRIADTPEVTRPYAVVIRGRTAAARTVEVRSETSGRVAATPTPQGAWVKAGQVLCRLDVDARQATLDQARANLRSRQLQYQAAQRLQEKGFRSDTQVASARADMDQAAAQVRQAEVALEQINIRAPFTGVFDRRAAEVGAYLAPGQACGTVVELNPLLVVGDLPEADAGRIAAGAPATATLAAGGSLHGKVRFVAREADPTTRTYRIEVIATNPDGSVRSGLSAQIGVEAGQGAAHLVPVSALVLDAAGRQGVRYVAGGNTVAFAPVKVLEETAQGVWVAGLRGPVRVITVGQSYVAEGQKVRVASR
jgi:multidrug efflux system membrane fusion protein